jgi:hypothetical protein
VRELKAEEIKQLAFARARVVLPKGATFSADELRPITALLISLQPAFLECLRPLREPRNAAELGAVGLA